jgi:hypothetical protein
MTGILLPAPVLVALDANGVPISGAQLQFYLTGTTTPTPVYTDDTLDTPLSNPVVANSAGLFPAIFLDPTNTYRAQLWPPGALTGTPIADRDPITVGVDQATQAQVNAGVATGVYVDPATLAGWTGVAAALGYTPVNKAGDTATNLVLANPAPVARSAGYLGAPPNEQDTNYTFVITDAGGMVRGNSAGAFTYTIPPNSSVAFPVVTAIVIRNVGAGTLSIAEGAGVTLTGAGAATAGTFAMAQWGLATLIQETANNWVIAGTGLTAP